MDGVKQRLFAGIDFDALASGGGLNEADVRAVIIEPLLRELGFTGDAVAREKALISPYLKTGSTKRPVRLIPDFVLRTGDRFAWVLDAKRPGENIVSGDNVEQVYCYAAHPEIRSAFFALCNGAEFAVFRTTDTEKPVLYFPMGEIDRHWEDLRNLLSADTFQNEKTFMYAGAVKKETPAPAFDYNQCKLPGEIPVRKRACRRHFGVHGYFTRQSWNIVSAYIKNFSQEGDLVLDSFGGSGVTAIEALVSNRKAVNIDINPLAVFIVRALLAPVDLNKLSEAYSKVRAEYASKEPGTKAAVKKILAEYPGPKDLALPKGSDVKTVAQLFSPEQTAKLALFKAIIKKQKDKNIRDTLLLVFSGMVTRVNLTFHVGRSATEKSISGSNAAAFQYYRYRMAPNPTSINFAKYLDIRFKKVLAAKREIAEKCLLYQKSAEEAMRDVQILKGSATDLSFLPDESVDYIYTDPPYGKKIPYLDLSVMWNAWLDLKVTKEDYELEAIEDGELDKSKEEYNRLIARSIEEMYRVLKFDRWLSFVFAHKDPEFWHLIIDTAERCGFEYIGAVPQKNGQTSFKKRQHPFTVLSGQLIINFRKVRNPQAVLKANLGMDIGEIVLQTIEGIIAKNDGATLEQINDELIIKGLELGFLDLLKKEYTDLTPLLLERFDYDAAAEKYTLKKNTKFQTHVDVKLRIRYYLLSFLRRMEREQKIPTFNEIVFHIMPLLKNGVTPEHQTILAVLEDIAVRTGENGWKLKQEQGTLFEDV